MKWNISDLLDCLQEETVNIQPCAEASADRIKELTMKKIHSETKPKRRGLPALLKIAMAAAIITSLAIPVMAATGFRLTDWLEGLNKSDIQEWQEHYESWENTEGFWQIGLTARDLTREGMTLFVREAQDSPVTGSLTIHGGYWLEQWNGEAFVEMTPAGEIEVGADREIKDGDSFELSVNWAEAYGQLESGRYRLGKDFTYTYSDGKTAQLIDWAEFRIFNEDMTPYIEQCKDALDELMNRESSHISFNHYMYTIDKKAMDEQLDYEIWRSGDDHLLIRSMVDYGENTSGRWGEMLLDNRVGIDIRSWVNDDVMQGAENWKYDDLLSPELNQFGVWHFWLKPNDSKVGEIWVEENTIGLLCADYPEPETAVYTERIFRFDEAGKLVSGELWYLPEPNCAQEEKRINCEMTVHDTSAGDIARSIDAQNVGGPDSFSWAQEREEAMEKRGAVITSGFNNTTPVTIENGYDAFMHGFNDYEVVADTHHDAKVSYDAAADMWKVEYMWAGGNIHATVYMNGQGVTQMTVMEDYE